MHPYRVNDVLLDHVYLHAPESNWHAEEIFIDIYIEKKKEEENVLMDQGISSSIEENFTDKWDVFDFWLGRT